MLRAGLATVLLMGLGSTAFASDRVRVYVDYDSGGPYHTGRHYNDRDCRDHRHWSTRRDYRSGYYAPYGYYSPAPRYRYYGYAPSYGWGLSWDSGRDRHRSHRDWDRHDRRGWDRDHRRNWDRDDRRRDWDRDGRRDDRDGRGGHDRRRHEARHARRACSLAVTPIKGGSFY
jgi:hypothetical protein